MFRSRRRCSDDCEEQAQVILHQERVIVFLLDALDERRRDVSSERQKCKYREVLSLRGTESDASLIAGPQGQPLR